MWNGGSPWLSHLHVTPDQVVLFQHLSSYTIANWENLSGYNKERNKQNSSFTCLQIVRPIATGTSRYAECCQSRTNVARRRWNQPRRTVQFAHFSRHKRR